MSSRPYKRRNYFTHKGFQTRFILGFVGVATVAVLLTVVLFDLLAQRQIERLLYSTHISVTSTGEAVLDQLIYVNLAIAAGLAVAVFLTLRALLWRASGPLFRIKKDLLSVADGDLCTNVMLRRNDEFQELAGDLRAMVGSLHTVFSRARTSQAALRGALHELDKATYTDAERMRAAAAVVGNRARDLQDVLGEIKTS